MYRARKRIIIYISIAVAILLIAGIGIFAARQSSITPDRLLSLGEKYLSELSYEQALVQFLKVIEIDPMNERAYLGASEAYIGLGQPDKAVEILDQGLGILPDSAAIRQMLDELKPAPELEVQSQSEPEPTVPAPVNLTGREPFTLQDLDDWGIPYGSSIWDVQNYFGLVTEDILAAIDRLPESEDSGSTSFAPITAPALETRPYDGLMIYVTDRSSPKLGWITIHRHPELLQTAPRETMVGMNYKDVLLHFMIHDEIVLEDFERIYDLGQQVKYIYKMGDYWAEISSISNGGIYLDYHISKDENRLFESSFVSLSFSISTEGVVERIDINYVH